MRNSLALTATVLALAWAAPASAQMCGGSTTGATASAQHTGGGTCGMMGGAARPVAASRSHGRNPRARPTGPARDRRLPVLPAVWR